MSLLVFVVTQRNKSTYLTDNIQELDVPGNVPVRLCHQSVPDIRELCGSIA